MRGKRSVFKKGDKIIIDPPKIVLEKTDAVCIPALPPLLHYAIALNVDDPAKLGLSKNPNYAYIRCVDPGEPYTEDETVIFRCRRVQL